MQVSPCRTWRLAGEDMEFIFRMHPEILDGLLMSFKKVLSRHMKQHSDLYSKEKW